jgi:hypothetical protein
LLRAAKITKLCLVASIYRCKFARGSGSRW